MEREIKFRGIAIGFDKWAYGYYVNRTPLKHQIITLETVFPTLVDGTTIGQFTGLKDKQVVEIYQGDIVIMSAGLFKNIPMEVKWCEINLCFVLTFKGLSKSKEMKVTKQKSLLVIGNIHQHAHLLE